MARFDIFNYFVVLLAVSISLVKCAPHPSAEYKQLPSNTIKGGSCGTDEKCAHQSAVIVPADVEVFSPLNPSRPSGYILDRQSDSPNMSDEKSARNSEPSVPADNQSQVDQSTDKTQTNEQSTDKTQTEAEVKQAIKDHLKDHRQIEEMIRIALKEGEALSKVENQKVELREHQDDEATNYFSEIIRKMALLEAKKLEIGSRKSNGDDQLEEEVRQDIRARVDSLMTPIRAALPNGPEFAQERMQLESDLSRYLTESILKQALFEGQRMNSRASESFSASLNELENQEEKLEKEITDSIAKIALKKAMEEEARDGETENQGRSVWIPEEMERTVILHKGLHHSPLVSSYIAPPQPVVSSYIAHPQPVFAHPQPVVSAYVAHPQVVSTYVAHSHPVVVTHPQHLHHYMMKRSTQQ